jgi:hypothetical protein
MKRTTILISLLLIGSLLQAQDRPVSVSLRVGCATGIGMQFFSSEDKAIEGILTWRDQGIQLNVLREHYMPVFLKKSDHFFLGIGYGAHLGYEWRGDYHPSPEMPSHFFRSGPCIGVNGMASLEYCFYKVPVSIGVHYMPIASFSTTRFFRMNLWDVGMMIRWRLGR